MKAASVADYGEKRAWVLGQKEIGILDRKWDWKTLIELYIIIAD